MRWLTCLWLSLGSLAFGESLTFPETEKELKAAADVTEVTVDFPFTNQSDKVLEIKKLDAECSCMSAGASGGKLRYEPGESGVIRAKFDMTNFFGTVEKHVSIWMDGDRENAPSIRLGVKVAIPEVVKLEPKTVSWNLNEPASSKTIDITVEGSDPIHLKNITANSSSFRHELKELEAGKHYQLVITPVETNSVALTIFRIETDSVLERHRLKQVYATVRRAIPQSTTPASP